MSSGRRVPLRRRSDLRQFPAVKSFATAVTRSGSVVCYEQHFTSRHEKPADFCAEVVASCEYIGLGGFRYGFTVVAAPRRSDVDRCRLHAPRRPVEL